MCGEVSGPKAALGGGVRAGNSYTPAVRTEPCAVAKVTLSALP